jgi:hypothetical protein
MTILLTWGIYIANRRKEHSKHTILIENRFSRSTVIQNSINWLWAFLTRRCNAWHWERHCVFTAGGERVKAPIFILFEPDGSIELILYYIIISSMTDLMMLWRGISCFENTEHIILSKLIPFQSNNDFAKWRNFANSETKQQSALSYVKAQIIAHAHQIVYKYNCTSLPGA